MLKILFFFLFLFSSAFAVDLETFEREVKSNQDKVIEFKYLREQAKLLGIKHVYLFGGTAASWGNYIRNYLSKKETDRPFDFDYMSIYRANQDFDIVIDASVEQAQALESAMQAKFNYFSGTRPSWEVRLLNEQRADKEPILGFDFQNQHTDSHSTGLIDIMDCDDCIKDVRDMSNPKNAFLMDIYEGKLHYYFSPKHQLTSRFKKGMNPPILSVIRYFTKANQGKLLMREADIAILQKIIHDFNPQEASTWDPYVLKWLEKNAKKLIVNAIDMEFAWNLIDQMGLRSKLIALSNPRTENSMGWWLSKEPLRSKPLGTTGKTAKEIFGKDQIMVAHETNSFEAYESITKSHDLMANVLISRQSTEGEDAACGNGFYTRLGREGGRGTGLTIRFYLDPNAREGIDFTVYNDYIVINNKKALKVIPESLSMSPVEYFKKLAAGLEFDITDKGVTERLKRSISRQLNVMTFGEEIQIVRILEENLKSASPNKNLIQEWFDQEISTKYPEYLEMLIKQGSFDKQITHLIFSTSHWANHKRGVEFLEMLIKQGTADKEIARYVLNQRDWAKHPRGVEFLEILIKQGKADKDIAWYVLSQPDWAKHPRGAEFLEILIKKRKVDKDIAWYVLSQPDWAKHPRGAEFLELLIKQGTADDEIARYVLSQPDWAQHPRGVEFLELLIKQGKADNTIAWNVLNQRYWVKHERGVEFLETLIKRGEADNAIAWLLVERFWAKHERGVEFLETLIKRGNADKTIANHLLTERHWAQHPVIGKLKTLEDIATYREKLKAMDFCNTSFIKGSK